MRSAYCYTSFPPFYRLPWYLQFAAVTNVTFLNIYHRFLDGVDFLNFDLGLIL